MADNSTERDDRELLPAVPAPAPQAQMIQAGVIVAVAAAAVSLVAGIGTYLYIRFTQHRRKPPE